MHRYYSRCRTNLIPRPRAGSLANKVVPCPLVDADHRPTGDFRTQVVRTPSFLEMAVENSTAMAGTPPNQWRYLLFSKFMKFY